MKKLILFTMFLGLTAHAGVQRLSSSASVGSTSDPVYLTGSNVINATLPSCSLSNDGERHEFRGISDLTHCATVQAASGDSVDGASGQAVCAYQAAELSCDGANHNWVNLSYF